MLFLLCAFAIAALVVPALVPRFGTKAFAFAALPALAGFVHACIAAPGILAGTPLVERTEWVPQLGLTLDLRMDPLAWLLAMVATGVGALVMLYCIRYFRSDEPGLGRFAGILTAFAGSMYGLVVADDVYLLFVFWELTTVFSYLLIGHSTGRRASRAAALQALLVTTLGGLSMLAGLVLLSTEAGTSNLGELVAAAPTGPVVTVAVLLVLVGAVTKSAIFPFHFWLPGAMAAPTPVSAYLHAAAMVKAGLYLIARLAPGFAEVSGWRESLVVLGVLTMLLGGWRAMRETDLKLLLAYGTVGQLGFLTVVIGYGTRDTLLAGLALLLGHALFKSALFLTVGIVDHRAGTRDLRRLSGLGRRAPVLAAVGILAAASMAGVPPLLGFVAKEAALTSLLEAAESGQLIGWVALVGVAVGSVFTVAYATRFVWGAFWSKPGVEPLLGKRERRSFVASPALLALAGLVLGPAASFVDATIAPAADALPAGEHVYHLALWHGLEPALLISAGTLVLGFTLFWLRRRAEAGEGSEPRRRTMAADAYRGVLQFVDRSAARVTATVQRGSLPYYLAIILIVLVISAGAAVARVPDWPTEARLWDSPYQVVIGAIMIVAAVATTVASKRFQAVVLVGVTGLGMAVLFTLHGAPDLALTQVLVELVTLVAFVLVLRRLPARLGERNGSRFKFGRALLGAAVGILMSVIAVVALGARTATPISEMFPELAYEGGHGMNVVNVALVDLRGWDTMGELSVLIAAATGVASLVFISSRSDRMPDFARRSGRGIRDLETARKDRVDSERGPWLLAGRTLAPRNRSILLEVVVRLVFHALIVVSLYLLLVGHNAPGGGFAGGLVVGLALVARYLAAGRFELAAAAPVNAGALLGSGLAFAVGTAFVPLFFGADALTSTWFELDLGWFGEIVFVTSTLFDVGVYLVVIGLVLDILRSLGGEVDRQQEEEDDEAAGGLATIEPDEADSTDSTDSNSETTGEAVR
ncbi:Na+/H+ antiporter subunit A [Herbiconiux sp. L3-i23]|uniref:Na+/H+ antiporter subunit A n=1 Tax=Herbiconiux sp. L3-i23 TaxID=2905871 RepID=UPI00206EEA36|nr:Na+/H+ antiporter subunit A [Herbiconiux sp. L3-i23]BDI21745.1 monovalent cation/H+ antiporter subunit A [Herbiconiux sp. L3-i23]